MAKVKVTGPESASPLRPGLTPESRENQMIALAVDLAEKQLREGTASSQVITHYLKLGTTIAKLEKEKMLAEIELQKAKAKNLDREDESRELYLNAIKAMRKYSGHGESDDDEF